MRQYFKLIKNRTIPFDSLLIDKYHLMGLNEVDAMILIKLQSLLQQGKRKLSTKELAPTMSISTTTISKRLVELVNNGFVSLSLSEKDQSETFSLDETYRKLSAILEQGDEKMEVEGTSNDIKVVVGRLESEFKHMLSALDLEVVRHWISVDHFSLDVIDEALLECVKMRKLDVKYIDVLLNKKAKISTSIGPKENLQELFNNVYDKK
ncbi:MAG: DnaD domain protein [Bacilli bacterium]|nr:DnaD domain protein [Bacilli bacterium]